MGIGQWDPLSVSVRITRVASDAHLDRRATRHYIGLCVDRQSPSECFQTA